MMLWLHDKPVDLEDCRLSISRGGCPRELLVKVESLDETLSLRLGYPQAQWLVFSVIDLFQILRDGGCDQAQQAAVRVREAPPGVPAEGAPGIAGG